MNHIDTCFSHYPLIALPIPDIGGGCSGDVIIRQGSNHISKQVGDPDPDDHTLISGGNSDLKQILIAVVIRTENFWG